MPHRSRGRRRHSVGRWRPLEAALTFATASISMSPVASRDSSETASDFFIANDCARAAKLSPAVSVFLRHGAFPPPSVRRRRRVRLSSWESSRLSEAPAKAPTVTHHSSDSFPPMGTGRGPRGGRNPSSGGPATGVGMHRSRSPIRQTASCGTLVTLEGTAVDSVQLGVLPVLASLLRHERGHSQLHALRRTCNGRHRPGYQRAPDAHR